MKIWADTEEILRNIFEFFLQFFMIEFVFPFIPFSPYCFFNGPEGKYLPPFLYSENIIG